MSKIVSYEKISPCFSCFYHSTLICGDFEECSRCFIGSRVEWGSSKRNEGTLEQHDLGNSRPAKKKEDYRIQMGVYYEIQVR